MQFLDLSGVKSLWTAIKKETAKSKTTVEGESANGTNAYVSVTGAAVEGSSSDGHVNYVVNLHNAASKADVTAAKEVLYGGTIPTSDAVTLTSLNTAVSNLTSASSVTVEKLAAAEDGFLSSYVVKQNGNQVGATINIPKDFLVKSGSVRAAAATDEGIDAGTKVLDFVVNTADNSGTDAHLVIPVDELVDVYNGSDTISVSDANVIAVKVDASGEFLSVTSNGLKVSGISDAIATAKSEVIGDSETDTVDSLTIQGVKKYAANLNSSALNGVDDTSKGTNVKVTLGASNNKVTVSVDETELNTALNGKVNKVTGAMSGNIATFDSTGNITDSGKAVSDFATAAQGEKADSSVQTITSESSFTDHSDPSYVAVTTTNIGNGEVAIYSELKVVDVASASASLDGVATANDVKIYVDGKVNDLDSNIVSDGTTSGNNIAAAKSTVDLETQTAQYFLTGMTITDGKITSGTSIKIEGIPVATLEAVFNPDNE